MKHKHWYSWRTAKDAPSDLADEAETKYSAWARGYNDAVQTYLDEIEETLRREQARLS